MNDQLMFKVVKNEPNLVTGFLFQNRDIGKISLNTYDLIIAASVFAVCGPLFSRYSISFSVFF